MHRDRLYGDLTRCVTDRRGVVRGKRSLRRLDDLHCLFIRKEPPFDRDYLSMTYLLDFLRKKVFIINDPQGIRDANEKLSSLAAPRFAAEAVTGYRPDLIRSFLRKIKSRAFVLKPLFYKGGKGIVKGSGTSARFRKEIAEATHEAHEPVTVQRFIPHAKTGDKRILLLDGKALGAFTRIPGPGDFRANMALGGRAQWAEVNARDQRIITALKGYLRRNGLFFVGMDVLDGYLTEVNVTSPAGVPEINRFHGLKTEDPVVDFLEARSPR